MNNVGNRRVFEMRCESREADLQSTTVVGSVSQLRITWSSLKFNEISQSFSVGSPEIRQFTEIYLSLEYNDILVTNFKKRIYLENISLAIQKNNIHFHISFVK